MSDVSTEPDADYDPEDDELDDEVEGSAEGTTSSFGRTFGPLPEGVVTATGFAKVLEAQRGVKVRPQVIYAMAKSTKGFPAYRNPDDQRIVVPIAEGLAYWDAKEERKGSAGSARKNEPTAWEKEQARLQQESGE
jgi:hypothetical protein